MPINPCRATWIRNNQFILRSKEEEAWLQEIFELMISDMLFHFCHHHSKQCSMVKHFTTMVVVHYKLLNSPATFKQWKGPRTIMHQMQNWTWFKPSTDERKKGGFEPMTFEGCNQLLCDNHGHKTGHFKTMKEWIVVFLGSFSSLSHRGQSIQLSHFVPWQSKFCFAFQKHWLLISRIFTWRAIVTFWRKSPKQVLLFLHLIQLTTDLYNKTLRIPFLR